MALALEICLDVSVATAISAELFIRFAIRLMEILSVNRE